MPKFRVSVQTIKFGEIENQTLGEFVAPDSDGAKITAAQQCGYSTKLNFIAQELRKPNPRNNPSPIAQDVVM